MRATTRGKATRFWRTMLALVVALTLTWPSAALATPAPSPQALGTQSVRVTADEAISWVQSKLWQSLDYDGYYGAQAPDLIAYYFAECLGVSVVYANSQDFSWKELPAGLTRVQGGRPQKGDILIYTSTDGIGYVCIYESDNSLYCQNYNERHYVTRESIPYNNMAYFNYGSNIHQYWGCIHPDFRQPAPETSGRPVTRVADGTYVLRSAIGNKVLDIAGGSTDEGANAQLWQPLGNVNQIWRIGYNDSVQGNNIRLAKAGNENRWLDTSGGDGAANVQQWSGNNGLGQNWAFEDAGGGWYYVRNLYGYYLDVADGVDASGTNVHAWYFNGSNAQKWKPVRVSGVPLTRHPSGKFNIQSKLGELNLEIEGASVAEGANARVAAPNHGESQAFTIGWENNLECNNIHLAKTAGNERWLDAGHGDDGVANVSQYAGDGNFAQNWFFEDAGNGCWYIRNIFGYYLEVEGGRATSGANVRVAAFDGSDKQQWRTFAAIEEDPKTDIATASVSPIPEQTYTGTALTPKPTVTDGRVGLREGADYTLSYANNVQVGKATVTITGTGSYRGAVQVAFDIVPAEADTPDSPESPDASQSFHTLTAAAGSGGTISPSGVMTVAEGGSVTFEIAPSPGYEIEAIYEDGVLADLDVASGASLEYSLGGVISDHTLRVTFRAVARDAEPYTYTASFDGLTRTYTVGEAGSLPAGEWETESGVLVSSRTQLDGMVTSNGQHIALRSREPEKRDLSGGRIASIDAQEYTGRSVRPEVSVIVPAYGNLTEGVDYTVTYSNNVMPGMAWVLVRGIGDYEGTLSASFNIYEPEDPEDPVYIDLSLASVVVDPTAEWTGSAIEPRVSVWLNRLPLYELQDYTVEFRNNVNPGVATVEVRGQGEYYGVATATFVIARPTTPDDVYGGIPENDPATGWPANTDHWVDHGDGSYAGARWYVYRNGQLRRDCWVELKGEWYYLDESGQMAVGIHYLKYGSSTELYYMNPNHDGSYGKMSHGWLCVDGNWYYCSDTRGSGTFGKILTGWQFIDGSWYYLGADGVMQRNVTVDGYRLGSSGAMTAQLKTGWKEENGMWYYYDANGSMVKSAWVDGYYLTHDGTMATRAWVLDGSTEYHVDASGKRDGLSRTTQH